MANWMRAIGQAVPALESMEQTQMQKQRLAMEGQEMRNRESRASQSFPLEQQQRQANVAISEQQVNLYKIQVEEAKKAQAEGEAPWRVDLDTFLGEFDEEDKSKVLEGLKKTGKFQVLPDGGLLAKQRNKVAFVKDMEYNEKLIGFVTGSIKRKKEKEFLALNEEHEKLLEKQKEGKGDPEKLKVLEGQLDQARKAVELASKNSVYLVKEVRDRKTIRETLAQYGEELKTAPKQIQMAFQQALEAGSMDMFKTAVTEWNKIKETTTNPNEPYLLSLPETDPRRKSYIGGKAAIEGSKPRPVNVPAWMDALAIEKIGGGYDTPEGQAKFKEWYAKEIKTPEGRNRIDKFQSEYNLRQVPPSITYLQTLEGFTPVVTRGKGVGTIGEPTGLGRPLPAGEIDKISALEAMQNDIGEVKKLYKYGTKKENSNWVGPVSGRYGTIQEKYLGQATDDQVKFYSYVRDLKDALLRARSGAQINEQEYARLVTFLPDENVPASTFKSRLERFEAEINNVLSTKKKTLKESGYGKQGKQTESGGRFKIIEVK